VVHSYFTHRRSIRCKSGVVPVLVAALLVAAIACGGPQAGEPAGSEAPSLDQVESKPGSGTLEGVVIDVAADRPVSFAEVAVYAEDTGELAGTTTTDQRGRYKVPDLPPGSYRVVVSFSNLTSESRGVSLFADRPTPLRVELSTDPGGGPLESREATGASHGSIEGVVLDGVRGDPLGGATIEVSSRSMADPLFTIADERGHFRVAGLAAGTYVVSVYYSLVDKGNIEVRRSGVVVERGVVTRLTLELDTEVR
jgi:hypothetical protein